MILPATDSLAFGGLFREHINARAPDELWFGCYLLLFGVSHDLLSSCAQRKKQEELRYPDDEDRTCPMELDAPNQSEAV